jgi:hypothetical protein
LLFSLDFSVAEIRLNVSQASASLFLPLYFNIMSSAIDDTPQKSDDEVLSSTIKRDIERRINTADEMIDSIRAELFSPPSQQGEHAEMGFHDDDDGEMYDEIKRLPSVEEDIRQDLYLQDVDCVRRSFLRKADDSTQQPETDCAHQKYLSGSQEEIDSLWLFSMIAFWVIVFLKEWFATLR